LAAAAPSRRGSTAWAPASAHLRKKEKREARRRKPICEEKSLSLVRFICLCGGSFYAV